MQFSKSTDYALHALFHLACAQRCHPVGIKEISAALGVSESYLSKIMSKLRQDGIVRAAPGVNGGYELARPASQITFLDIIQVIEGREALFACSNSSSQQHRLVAEARAECMIEQVMSGAEQLLLHYLREYTLQFLMDEAFKHCPHEAGQKDGYQTGRP